MSTINGTPGNDILSTSTGGDFIDAGAGSDQVTLAFNPRSVWGPDMGCGRQRLLCRTTE